MINNFKSLSILYVEDDGLVQDNIGKILGLLFNHVYVANNGQEALNLFHTQHIHMILTDYEMPVMNGYEMASKIREVCEKTPIIFLSNFTEKEKLLKCIPLKLIAYLEKPIKYDSLIEELNNSLIALEKNHLLYFKINECMQYDYLSKTVISNNKTIPLTSMESSIFEAMIEKKEAYLSKEEIANLSSSGELKNENAIKNLIYRMRKKLGKELIENLKDMGYRLKLET